MKRIFSFFLILCLLLIFASCAKDPISTFEPLPYHTTESQTETQSETTAPVTSENNTTNENNDPSHIHSFSKATCTEAAKCHCGVVKGSPLGHDFTPASCIRPKICKICGLSSGEPEHVGGTATCTELPVCEICGTAYGEFAEHIFDEASGITCEICGEIRRINYEIKEEKVYITGCEYKFFKSIEIPETIDGFPVVSIGDSVFEGCNLLVTITLPNTIESIGERAFTGCSALKNFNVPENLTEIGKNAFSYCASLTDFEIPKGVKEIKSETFWSCSKLTNIVIPTSVKIIEEGAFRHCTAIEKITLPKVESIGDKAFANCTQLRVINISKSLKEVGYWTFSGCLYLQDVFYEGSKKDQKNMEIQLLNDFFTSAIWHYDSPIKTIDRERN